MLRTTLLLSGLLVIAGTTRQSATSGVRLSDLPLDRATWCTLPLTSGVFAQPAQTPFQLPPLQLPPEWGLALTSVRVAFQGPQVRLRISVNGGLVFSGFQPSLVCGVGTTQASWPIPELAFDPPLLIPPGATVSVEVSATHCGAGSFIFEPLDNEITIGGWKLLPGEF